MLDNPSQTDWTPVRTVGEDRVSRWLILCDHATNRVPDWVNGGDLGLPPEDMARHIAFDPGAAELTLALAERLGAPAVMTDFSRLVIDPNRGLDDPTLVMRIYDQTLIPANRSLDAAAVTARIKACYAPYDAEVARLANRREDTVIVSVHSFTPQLRGRAPRPWHIGLLFAEDDRLSLALAGRLEEDPDLVVGLNQPYSGSLHGDTIDRHALRQGRHNTLLEVRNDLIRTPEQHAEWADRLADTLTRALVDADTAATGD